MAGATPLPLLRLRPLSSSSSSASSSSSSSSSTQCFLQHLRSRESRFRCCGTPERTKPKQKPNCRTETPTSFPPDTSSSKFGSFNSRAASFSIGRIWEDLRVDDVVLEIASIALPAVLALAADPLTSLVDTAFVGHVGSVELAAVGVSVSVFNLVSKLFNVPLLNITTSFVAEEKALDGDKSKAENNNDQVVDGVDRQGKKFLPAVSTSLILAAGIGIVEAVMLFLGSGVFVDTMGIVLGSPMRIPSEQFLRLRALGAPAIVTALAAQGTFRGFLDTKTPLYAVVVGNLLNAILDPILMFVFHLGIEGAAVATVIADYVIVSILLWKLNDEVIIIPSDVDWGKIVQYLRSGALLIVRTIAVVGTVTLSTSMAARRGPIPMAGHQICLQVWLAVSLLNDALALAGQALLASEYTKGNYSHSRTIIYRVLQIGLITGCTLAVVLFIGFDSFCGLFTTDVAVLDIARSGTLFVTASQPINAIAFVLDGLYYGVSDFGYAAYSMLLVGFSSSLLLIALAPSFGLSGVWTGLFIFMVLRVVAGFWRLGSKEGPWKRIWSEVDVYTTEE